MPADFPDNPVVGESFSIDSRTWIWNGATWNALTLPVGAVPAQTVDSNITLTANFKYFVDTSAARTLTLPATPEVGDELALFDATGTAATYNVAVENNSEKINGVLDSVLIDVNEFVVSFIYTGSTYGWRMI